MYNEYLHSVEQRLKNEKSKKQILTELEGHIDDKIDYYLELGYSKEEAKKRAIEDMGEPDDAALPLRELHKKTYTATLMIVTLVYVVIVYIIERFVPAFRYSSGYTYIAGERAGNPHSFLMDFISFAIVAGFAVLLYLAYRQKSISVPIIIAVSLTVMIFSEWLLYHLNDAMWIIVPSYNGGIEDSFFVAQFKEQMYEFVPCAIFQPFIFAVAKTISSGFGGYTGSLFASGFLDVYQKGICKLGAVVLCLIFIGWAVYQLIIVVSQTRMIRTRTANKIISFFIRAVSCTLAVYLTVMLVCTAVASINRPDDEARALKEKTEMINEVLACSPDLLNEETFLSKEYKPYSPGKDDKDQALLFGLDSYFYKTETNNLIELHPHSQFNSIVEFHTTQGIGPLTEDELERLNGNDIQTFGDFIELGLLDRATDIAHIRYGADAYNGDLKIGEEFEIRFNYQGGEINAVYCRFEINYEINDPRPGISDFEMQAVLIPVDKIDYTDDFIFDEPGNGEIY